MINFAALEDMIRINERAPEIQMSTWIHDCGTHGCLCGNYTLVHREFGYGRGVETLALQAHLGITRKEFRWLFTSNPLSENDPKNRNYTLSASKLTGPEALARLKKFVAYKRDKASVSIKQGRRISGTMVCHRLSLGV